jgi:hypothetical protein
MVSPLFRGLRRVLAATASITLWTVASQPGRGSPTTAADGLLPHRRESKQTIREKICGYAMPARRVMMIEIVIQALRNKFGLFKPLQDIDHV